MSVVFVVVVWTDAMLSYDVLAPSTVSPCSDVLFQGSAIYPGREGRIISRDNSRNHGLVFIMFDKWQWCSGCSCDATEPVMLGT